MQRTGFAVAIVVAIQLGAATARADDDGISYQVGFGVSLPVGSYIDELTTTGINVNGGGYMRIATAFNAGIHVTYNIPFGVQQTNGEVPDAQFTGILVRAMYLDGTESVAWFVGLGIGLSINKVPICGAFCEVEKQVSAAGDLSAGIAVKLGKTMSIGPQVTISAPNFADFQELLMLGLGLSLQHSF